MNVSFVSQGGGLIKVNLYVNTREDTRKNTLTWGKLSGKYLDAVQLLHKVFC